MDLNPEAITLLAFGGSTTHGFPYDRERWPWPQQLETMLNTFLKSHGKEAQVVNLGYIGEFMDMNFPPLIRPFLEEVKPEAILINCLINDYSQQRGVTTLRHHLGDWRYRTKDRPGTLEAYLERLERVIKLCQSVSPPLRCW